MFRLFCILTALSALSLTAAAQDYYPQPYGGEFYGPVSVGSIEPLFGYDDQEPWKHGYLHVMPYYGGHHKFLPYNYKSVFSQSQVAAGWGMPNVMPYSQQFWHRYEQQADLSQPRALPSALPQPGYLPPSGEAQPWLPPASHYVPTPAASSAAYSAASNDAAVQSISKPRGGESLRGPRLP